MTLHSSELWLSRLQNEVKNNILGFWLKHTPDEVHGGFVGEIDSQMNVRPEADKSLVLNARILWTFSSAYRLFGDSAYLQAAERALDVLERDFADREHGGFFWMVHAGGSPSQTKKQVYGQAFVIYALAEYFRAVRKPEALDRAIELFRLLEKYGYDPVHSGYIEALSREWQMTDDLSLSGKDLNEKKSMNTHLHVLEAYTGLYRVWKSEELRVKLAELIGTMLDHIVDKEGRHFLLFFDEQWNVKSDHVSYGHDIEGSWLLFEAAEVLGDEEVLERVTGIAIRMAEAALAEGVDKDGGIWNEAGPEGLLSRDKDWWPQAEAMVGFYNAYQLTGDVKFREAAYRSWQFIDKYIVDHKLGEWHWGVSGDLRPLEHEPKVSAWKCPYHNGRACFEMIERIPLSVKEH